MKTLKAKLVGIAPIMFHSERLANPTDKFTKELKKLTDVRKKTDQTREEIKMLEWRGGFYEHEGRPVVPADNILACILQGARKLKKGKDVSAGVIEGAPHFLLEYEGPKTIDKLKEDARFMDYRSVVIAGRRTMRARPIFKDWGLRIEVKFDPDIIQESELWQSLEIAGERIGLCERRPRLGRFLVERT
jgi:hypothetical protein